MRRRWRSSRRAARRGSWYCRGSGILNSAIVLATTPRNFRVAIARFFALTQQQRSRRRASSRPQIAHKIINGPTATASNVHTRWPRRPSARSHSWRGTRLQAATHDACRGDARIETLGARGSSDSRHRRGRGGVAARAAHFHAPALRRAPGRGVGRCQVARDGAPPREAAVRGGGAAARLPRALGGAAQGAACGGAAARGGGAHGPARRAPLGAGAFGGRLRRAA